MKKLFQEKMKVWLYIPAKKRENLREIFSHIAPKYNVATVLLSFGQDQYWKKILVGNLPQLATPYCVDLACGTGDITLLLAEKFNRGNITGLDISEGMLEIARKKTNRSCVVFKTADMGNLTDIPSNSVDIVTGGYALRNAADLSETLQEIKRILKPEGIAAFLEFSKTPLLHKQKLQHNLLKIWGSFWGIVLHANYKVYAYLAESLWAFPDREQLKSKFLSLGFSDYQSKLVMRGMLEIIQCKKSNICKVPTPEPD